MNVYLYFLFLIINKQKEVNKYNRKLIGGMCINYFNELITILIYI